MFDVFRSSLGELDPLKQFSRSKGVGLANMGILILVAYMLFGVREFGHVSLVTAVATVASYSKVGGFIVEGLNMIDNFLISYLSGKAIVSGGMGQSKRYKLYSNLRLAERVAVAVVGLGFVAGMSAVTVYFSFLPTYVMTAPLILFAIWSYIVVPGKPVFGIPFGFLAIQWSAVFVCFVLGIPFDMNLI